VLNASERGNPALLPPNLYSWHEYIYQFPMLTESLYNTTAHALAARDLSSAEQIITEWNPWAGATVRPGDNVRCPSVPACACLCCLCLKWLRGPVCVCLWVSSFLPPPPPSPLGQRWNPFPPWVTVEPSGTVFMMLSVWIRFGMWSA
jgi:hypothetical protein